MNYTYHQTASALSLLHLIKYYEARK